MIDEMKNEKYHDYQDYIESKRDLELMQKEYEAKLIEVRQLHDKIERMKIQYNQKYEPNATTINTYERDKKKHKLITRILILIMLYMNYLKYTTDGINKYIIGSTAILLLLLIVTFIKQKKKGTKVIDYHDHKAEYIQSCWDEVEKENGMKK